MATGSSKCLTPEASYRRVTEQVVRRRGKEYQKSFPQTVVRGCTMLQAAVPIISHNTG